MTRPGIEPRSPGPLANTLTAVYNSLPNNNRLREIICFNKVYSMPKMNLLKTDFTSWSLEDRKIWGHTSPTMQRSLLQNAIEKLMKTYILHFAKKGDLGHTKIYRGITLIAIVSKVYNVPLRNCIRPEIEKIIFKSLKEFRRYRFTTSQILTIRLLYEGVQEKSLMATLLFVVFSITFKSFNISKM